MKHSFVVITALIILAFVAPGRTFAGMPSVTLADVPRAVRALTRTELSDLARQRLEVISFFSLCLLASGWMIQQVWNRLRKDFAHLPRLSFGRALGIAFLWGLLFVLVLTIQPSEPSKLT